MVCLRRERLTRAAAVPHTAARAGLRSALQQSPLPSLQGDLGLPAAGTVRAPSALELQKGAESWSRRGAGKVPPALQGKHSPTSLLIKNNSLRTMIRFKARAASRSPELLLLANRTVLGNRLELCPVISRAVSVPVVCPLSSSCQQTPSLWGDMGHVLAWLSPPPGSR